MFLLHKFMWRLLQSMFLLHQFIWLQQQYMWLMHQFLQHMCAQLPIMSMSLPLQPT